MSVKSGSQGVNRQVSIDTLDVLDAFLLTRVDVLDGKTDGNLTVVDGTTRSLKTSSENRHFGRNFLRALMQGLACFQMRIDHRLINSMVTCKRLIRNVVNLTATAVLPLLASVFTLIGGFQHVR